ncbi:MAG: hypothetical protein WCP28_15320 [Actinomycetes bacterium]
MIEAPYLSKAQIESHAELVQSYQIRANELLGDINDSSLFKKWVIQSYGRPGNSNLYNLSRGLLFEIANEEVPDHQCLAVIPGWYLITVDTPIAPGGKAPIDESAALPAVFMPTTLGLWWAFYVGEARSLGHAPLNQIERVYSIKHGFIWPTVRGVQVISREATGTEATTVSFSANPSSDRTDIPAKLQKKYQAQLISLLGF